MPLCQLELFLLLSNKSMDVRAKQRLCYLACPFTLTFRVGGFAPRHLNRWAAALEIGRKRLISGEFI